MQEDIIKDIRKRCRMAMNGVASTSMREYGLNYKLNFGLIIQQIKDVANRYTPNSKLAETLWKEDTRELKILATLLYPIDEFDITTANRWVQEIPNQEIREQICINLFQNLSFANQLAIDWTNNNSDNIKTSGYWLMVRLFLAKKIESIIYVDYFKYIWEDVLAEDIFLRNAALLTIKHIGRQSQQEAKIILEKISDYKDCGDPLKQELYNSIAFEFEFYFG